MKKVILAVVLLAMVGCGTASRKVVGINLTKLNNYEYKLVDSENKAIIITSESPLDMNVDDKIRIEKEKK